MTVVLLIGACWLACAIPVGVLIGRRISRREATLELRAPRGPMSGADVGPAGFSAPPSAPRSTTADTL